MPFNAPRAAFATSLLSCSIAALAQTSNDSVALDNMVVTAAGFEQKITDAPASITVIGREELQRNRVSSLAEALAEVEGVDVAGTAGKTGGLNISIRGMGSAYTLVLIDGRRQNTAGDVTPNGFGETSTSFIPPVSAIERIEVIRGPMSTLYGSDAMGGVINIITRKVGQEWTGSITAETTLQEQDAFGDSRGGDLYLSGPLVAERVGLALRGRYFERDASSIRYETVNGEQVIPWMGRNPVESDIHSYGGRLTFTPTQAQDFYLDYEQARQRYDNNEGQLGTLGAAGGYEEEQRYNREQFILAHTGRFAFGTLQSSLMRNTTETIGRLVPSRLTSTPGVVPGSRRTLESENTVFDTKLLTHLGNHSLTVGGQWWQAELVDGVVADPFEQKMTALFIEDEWRLRENLALTLGLRRDQHDNFGGQTSPRAYLVWNANDSWTLKGGVSKGFKAPNVEDLADGINGFGRQGALPLIGNPDLQPETSTSSEIGAYFDNLQNFSANLTLFHNQFHDKLSSTTVDNCRVTASAGCVDIGPGWEAVAPTFNKAINVDEAVTRGAELAGRYAFAPGWTLAANYTYTETEQKSGTNAGWPLNNTPRHMANASLNWQATDRLSTWLRGEYRSERFRRTSAATNYAYEAFGDHKAYSLFHLGGSYRASENLTFNATLYNLFDKDFIDYRPYVSNAAGAIAYDNRYNNNQERRRLWLAATYVF